MTRPASLKQGRYSVLGVLGGGRQGETLEAVDTTNGSRVAVKRFVVRGAASWKDVELAEREARVLATLDHVNLPRYLEHFEEDGALCLVMEKVEGESLRALRLRGGGLPRSEVMRLLEDTGRVLDYLHGRAPPIVHRDVKPANVIRRPDGSFALVDFGSVRDSLKPEGGSTVVGTFGYMAPEQFQGRALPQSDVYALGATALALLTGREPEDLPHRGLAIDVAAALPHDPPLAAVLSRMLEPDPDRRAVRVAPLLDELSAAGESRSRRAAAGERSGFPHERAPFVLSPFVVLALLVGLAVARVSTTLLFRFLLPVLLTLLAILFGGGLRRAAERMRDIGKQGEAGLAQAVRFVRGEHRRHRERARSGARGRKTKTRVETVIETQGEEVRGRERTRRSKNE